MASIDVAIPCYQYGRYLRECVTSVLTQDISALRVLIIDNASTDNSVQVARRLAAEDPRVEVVAHATNLGPHASYNEAIDWAQSDYFLLLDADDFLLEGALQRVLSFMEKNPDVAFTYGRAPFISLDGKMHPGSQVDERIDWEIISGENFIKQFCGRPIYTVAPSTVIRRTSAQKKAGYYRPELPYSDDMELWLRLAMLGKVARTGKGQAVQRFHLAQHSFNYTNKIERDFNEREAAVDSFFAHEGKALDNAGSLLANARRSLAAHAYWSAGSQLCKGNFRSSLCLIRFALTRRPSILLVPPVEWLLGTDRPFTRIKSALWEPVRSLVGLAVRRKRRIAD